MGPRGKRRLAGAIKVAAKAAGATPMQAWAAAAGKLRQRIADLEAQPPLHGGDWQRGQLDYWRRLLRDLEANKPK